MNRLYTFVFALVAFSAAAMAQTLNVQGDANVWWQYNAAQLTAPSAFDATGVTLGDHHYTFADGTVMTVDDSPLTADAVRVEYSGATARVFAPGTLADVLTIKVDRANVDITVAPGFEREIFYTLTGEGSTFTLHGDYKSTIVLSGVTLAATLAQPALWIDNGKRIDFDVVDGTTNTFADVATNEKKSAFFVKGHAEWKGSGTVSIAGASRHAYSSNEYTKFKTTFTGTFNVTAAGSDAMHIDQYLEVNSGTLNLSGMKGDGIDVACALEDDGVTKTQDEFNGQFLMNGGVINVKVAADDTKGVKCEDVMTITAGRINATASGAGSRGIQAGTNLILGVEGAASSAAYLSLTATGGDYTDPETDDVSKCRGLKVKQDLYHYPSTIERNATSTVTAKKIVDVDRDYYKRGGTLSGITISPGGAVKN